MTVSVSVARIINFARSTGLFVALFLDVALLHFLFFVNTLANACIADRARDGGGGGGRSG